LEFLPGSNLQKFSSLMGFLLHRFAHFVHALRLFKALHLFFLTHFPGPTVILCPTSIPDSRVTESNLKRKCAYLWFDSCWQIKDQAIYSTNSIFKLGYSGSKLVNWIIAEKISENDYWRKLKKKFEFVIFCKTRL
jgi:hypothetical protein